MAIFDDDDEGPLRDSPYTNEDLNKPGFDPFEAHYAWLERRRQREFESAIAPQARIDEVLRHVDEALAKFKAEQKRPKRKKKVLTESQRTVKQWKDALAAVRKRP